MLCQCILGISETLDIAKCSLFMILIIDQDNLPVENGLGENLEAF